MIVFVETYFSFFVCECVCDTRVVTRLDGLFSRGALYWTKMLLLMIWRRTILIAHIFYVLLIVVSIKMTGSPGQTRTLMWINMTSSWEKICKLIFFQILVSIWWHWVSRGYYLLVLGGTGSVLGVLGGNWLYWVVIGCTGSVWGSTDWYLIVLGR